MKVTHLFYTGIIAAAVVVSCQKKEEQPAGKNEPQKEEQPAEKKRKSLDFSPLKTELKLDTEKEKRFDEITTKFQKMREENFQTAKQSGKIDRVALGKRNEEITKQQTEEMSQILNPEQMEVFNKFIEENSRKRPRYNDELLAKIQKEAELSDEQMKIVNAANDAFEKSFHDAHDVYHGNNDLAKEYWEKFDTQRKVAIKKALSPEQYTKFEEAVKDINFKPRKK